MRLDRIVAAAVATVVVAAAVEPGVTRLCRVARHAGVAWSDEVPREVTFVSGAELNRILDGARFERTATYAVLRNGPSEIIVLRLDDVYLADGLRFDERDFRALFSSTESMDFTRLDSADRERWRIRARSGRRFFDAHER